MQKECNHVPSRSLIAQSPKSRKGMVNMPLPDTRIDETRLFDPYLPHRLVSRARVCSLQCLDLVRMHYPADDDGVDLCLCLHHHSTVSLFTKNKPPRSPRPRYGTDSNFFLQLPFPLLRHALVEHEADWLVIFIFKRHACATWINRVSRVYIAFVAVTVISRAPFRRSCHCEQNRKNQLHVTHAPADQCFFGRS